MIDSDRDWLTTHAQECAGSLEKHAVDLYGYLFGDVPELPLSDLALCGAVSRGLVPLPPDYVIQHVKMESSANTVESHFIGLKDDKVIDVVAGQIWADEVQGISGIAQMAQLAPHLLLELTSQVTVLIGTKEEIRSELGIIYNPIIHEQYD